MSPATRMVLLGDVADLKDSLHQTPRYLAEGEPMIRVTDIKRGFLNLSNTLKVSPQTYDTFAKRYAPQAGDIIFSRVGSYGISTFVDRPVRFCLGQNTVCLAPRRDLIDPFYFYSCLNSPAVQNQIDSVVGGASQPTISLKNIAALQLPFPEISIQKRVSQILYRYENLIENNTRRIEILEKMAQLLYREWFINFRFPGHGTGKMVDTEAGPIPGGWTWKRLASLVETQYGYTESATDKPIGPKYLRGMDINKTSFIDWAAVPYCPISEKAISSYRLKKGDIVVIRMADPGKVGIVEEEVEAVFASYLIRLKIVEAALSPYYLFYFLSSDRYQNYVAGASTGTTRKSASAGVITDIDIVIPAKSVREEFESNVTGVRRMLINLLKRNSVLRRTRDLLLPKLVSGEVNAEDFKQEALAEAE